MPLIPDPPFPKTQGDNIRSKDWNDAVNEIVRLDVAKANRAGAETFAGPLTINGSVGIGTGAPAGALDVVAASWNTHLRLTNVANNGAGPALYLKSSVRDWAVIATHGGATAGPGKFGVYDATASEYRLVIDAAGNVGAGVAAPAESLHAAARVRAGNLTVGPWPANGNYQFVGASTLDQTQGGNYALLQSAAGGDLGTTYLNSPETVRLRIGNVDRAVVEKDGSFTFNASTNALRVTTGFSGFVDTAPNRAEISNDTGSYKTLMIVGNRSNGGVRRVSVWDRLEVNGDLFVTGRIGSFGKSPDPLKAGWGGGLHTWDIEAEGTMWCRNGLQTGPRDLAEVYFSDLALEPGDVVSLDPDADRIVPARGPGDSAVIGIVSSQPGMLLGSQMNLPPLPDGIRGYPIALCGCVPCKVSAENGAIRRGDLLTAASKPGHAMRAGGAGSDGRTSFAAGTLIGKALAAHAEGEGEIEVFVILR